MAVVEAAGAGVDAGVDVDAGVVVPEATGVGVAVPEELPSPTTSMFWSC